MMYKRVLVLCNKQNDKKISDCDTLNDTALLKFLLVFKSASCFTFAVNISLRKSSCKIKIMGLKRNDWKGKMKNLWKLRERMVSIIRKLIK